MIRERELGHQNPADVGPRVDFKSFYALLTSFDMDCPVVDLPVRKLTFVAKLFPTDD